MQKYNSDEVLFRLTDMLFERLDELNEPLEENDNPDFILGSKTAYVECLEMLQATWDQNDITEDIEALYPIM